MIAKLEQRVRELETELDGEQRRFQEANKNMQKADRRVRELQFQVPNSFISDLKAITNDDCRSTRTRRTSNVCRT